VRVLWWFGPIVLMLGSLTGCIRSETPIPSGDHAAEVHNLNVLVGKRTQQASPWFFDKTAWKTWTRFESLQKSAGNKNSLCTLTLKVVVRLPDDEPVYKLAGRLRLSDRQGKCCYDEPFTISDTLGFCEIATYFLDIPYDASSPDHQALRQFTELSADFKPQYVEYADGTQKTFDEG